MKELQIRNNFYQCFQNLSQDTLAMAREGIDLQNQDEDAFYDWFDNQEMTSGALLFLLKIVKLLRDKAEKFISDNETLIISIQVLPSSDVQFWTNLEALAQELIKLGLTSEDINDLDS